MMTKQEMIEGLALNGAMYLKSNTTNEIEAGSCMNAFDLSFAMEILTGVPKEECINLIIKGQEKIAKSEEAISKILKDKV